MKVERAWIARPGSLDRASRTLHIHGQGKGAGSTVSLLHHAEVVQISMMGRFGGLRAEDGHGRVKIRILT